MVQKANKIEPRTKQFVREIDKMIKAGTYPGNDAMAAIIGGNAKKNTVSEIKSHRQNIQPEHFWPRIG